MFDDDYIVDDDLEQLDYSTPDTSRKSFEKGKRAGRELGKKIQDGSLKEDINTVKEGINDIKDGNIKEGLGKVKDGLIDDRNAVEKAGHDIKETGKAIKETGKSMEDTGKNLKKANEVGEKGAKVAEKGAKAADAGGKALEGAGTATAAAGAATKTTGAAVGGTGDVVNAAGGVADATVVGAPAGVALNTVGTVASAGGKIAQAVGSAEEGVGKAEQAAGKAQQVAAKGVETGAKGLQLQNKLGQKFGDNLEKAGKLTKDTGEKVEKAGEKIENTGKDLKNELKPFTGTLDVLKNLPKILIAASVVAVFIFITFSYYKKMSPVTESMEKFINYVSDNNLNDVTSNIYSSDKNKDYEKFYEELQKWYEKSNGQLDVPLVYSVLFYTDMDNNEEFDFSEDTDEDDGEDYSDILSLTKDEASDYIKGKTKRLRLICKNMLDSNNKPVSDDVFKEFLRTKYINKKPEFKEYFKGLKNETKADVIESIINDMYKNRDYYVQIFGDGKSDISSESYENTCLGAIDNNLISELGLPVNTTKTIDFGTENAYGLVNGKVHNGVDLNAETAGVNEGDTVYSIQDGTVVDVKSTVSAVESTINEAISKTNSGISNELGGTSIKIKHENIVIGEKRYTFYSVYKNLNSSSVTLQKGDSVSKGDEIGKVGTTNSGVAQLHFEFRNESDKSIDPTNLFIKCITNNGVLVGNTDEEKIWNYFLLLGYPKAGIAGIMGNMQSESHFNSMCVQGDYLQSDPVAYDTNYTNSVNNKTISENDFVRKGPGGGGYGLAQWTWYTRKQGLYDRTVKNNISIGDLNAQLTYYDYELQNLSDFSSVYQVVTTTNDVRTACNKVFHDYESPLDQSTTAEEGRYTNCKTIYDKYKDNAVPNVSSSNNGAWELNGAATGDGYPEGTYKSSSNLTFKQFRQDTGSYASNSYWSGTIASSGCGPTSVAILASGLTNKNLTPADTARSMRGNTGQGTLSAEMQRIGLSTKLIEKESADDITRELKNGNVMLVSVGSSTIFTSNSHIMAVVDINSNGQVYVINPNSQGRTSSPSGWYNPTELIDKNGSHNDYIITTPAVKINY